MAAQTQIPEPSKVEAGLIAFLIERTCGHYVATISAVMLALALSLPAWTSFVPAKYQGAYLSAIGLLVAVGGALAKFKD